MHNHFDPSRWAQLSLYEQMGNIGSEVGRAMNAARRHDLPALQGAYFRGLDLIDATVDTCRSVARRRELLRAREVFASAVETQTADTQLENYFMQYAFAARSSQ